MCSINNKIDAANSRSDRIYDSVFFPFAFVPLHDPKLKNASPSKLISTNPGEVDTLTQHFSGSFVISSALNEA